MSSAPTAASSADRRLGLLMAATTAVLWGFLAIALKVALGRVPTVTIVWFRFAVAFPLLCLLVGARRPSRLAILARPPVLGVLSAVGLTANYVTYLMGVDMTSPSNAQVLIQLAPLLLAGTGVLWFGERLTRRQMGWGLVALAGMVLFYRDQLGQLVGEGASRHLEGNLWIVVGAVSWTAYAALQKLVVARGASPQDLNLVLYLLPCLVLWPWVEWDALAALSPAWWGLMAFLGLNTLLAYGALGEALKRLPAHEVSLIIICNPLITLVTMAVLTALEVSWIAPDRVGLTGYLAGGVVVLGVFGFLRKPGAGRGRRA